VDGLGLVRDVRNSGGYSTVFHVHIKDGADPACTARIGRKPDAAVAGASDAFL